MISFLALNTYVEESLAELEKALSALATKPKPSWDKLNLLFLSLLTPDVTI
jgi:hypothetical protein